MATRITISNVCQARDILNRRLEALGSEARVVVERRYGYVAIDEADTEGAIRRTLTTGNTHHQAYDALLNMIRVLDLLPRAERAEA